MYRFVKLQNLLWNSSLLFVVAWHPRFCPRSFVLWLHIYHGVVLLVADRNSWILCHIPVHQAHLCSCENWLRWSTMQRTNLTLKQQLGERIGSNGLVLVLCTCIRWHHAFKISTVSFGNEQFCWIWMFNILHWKFVLSKCAGGIIYCTPFILLISVWTFTLCLMMRKWFFNRTFLLCKFSGRICLK